MNPSDSLLTYSILRKTQAQSLRFGSNSVQHGTAVFEGIRSYVAEGETVLFRLDDHINRLLRSADLLGIKHDFSREVLHEGIIDAVRFLGGGALYVRPVLFTPDPRIGGNLQDFTFDVCVELWRPPGKDVRTDTPARLALSPWCRPSAKSFPIRAKATGTYVTSALARTEAVSQGFDDAIQMDPHSGRVAEATVTNVFIVEGSRLVTPWLEDSVLDGITRRTVLQFADDLDLEAVEEPVSVDRLLAADEVFLTGTASEVIPVALVGDRTYQSIEIGRRVAAHFSEVVSGRATHPEWLTEV